MLDVRPPATRETELRPAAPARIQSLTFRDYVLARKYDFGRGSAATWAFIAYARGDRTFPEIATQRELDDYLARAGVSGELATAARSVWSSFTSYRSRMRAKVAAGIGAPSG